MTRQMRGYCSVEKGAKCKEPRPCYVTFTSHATSWIKQRITDELPSVKGVGTALLLMASQEAGTTALPPFGNFVVAQRKVQKRSQVATTLSRQCESKSWYCWTRSSKAGNSKMRLKRKCAQVLSTRNSFIGTCGNFLSGSNSLGKSKQTTAAARTAGGRRQPRECKTFSLKRSEKCLQMPKVFDTATSMLLLATWERAAERRLQPSKFEIGTVSCPAFSLTPVRQWLFWLHQERNAKLHAS